MSVKTKFESMMNVTPVGKGYSISKSYLMMITYSKTQFKVLKQSWPLD